MAGRLSQLKDTVASKLTNDSDDDERVDQLEARQERARVEARREARKEARQQRIEEAREQAREEELDSAFEDDDSGGILDRALDALEDADPGGQGQQSADDGLGMMDMGGDSGMADPFGGDEGDPFGDPFGGDGGGGSDPASGMADPWTGDAGDEEDVLESMGFDTDDDDGWY